MRKESGFLGVSFNLNELFGRVWSGLPFPELLARNSGGVKGFFLGTEQEGVSFASGSTGRPVQAELTLGLNGEELRFAVPPICTIQNSLNVVETVVAGLNGSIKEIVSVNDYNVNIKGFLVESTFGNVEQNGYKYRLNSKEFPEKELRQIRRFFEAKKPVEVIESRLLSYFNIKKMLFKSISFPELEGYVSVIPFEIEAVSDTEYTLIIE
jgi:hypothetical protein